MQVPKTKFKTKEYGLRSRMNSKTKKDAQLSSVSLYLIPDSIFETNKWINYIINYFLFWFLSFHLRSLLLSDQEPFNLEESFLDLLYMEQISIQQQNNWNFWRWLTCSIFKYHLGNFHTHISTNKRNTIFDRLALYRLQIKRQIFQLLMLIFCHDT